MIERQNLYAKLVDYIDQFDRVPFSPGVHDCALFVAGAIAIQTGIDHAEKWRGQYQTIDDGLSLMRAEGFADHVAFADHVLTPIAPSMAKNGDIGAIQAVDGLALGVVLGGQIRVPALLGMGIMPRSRMVLAWSIDADDNEGAV